jgi:NDP-sugar pyrophosphorylase family protein
MNANLQTNERRGVPAIILAGGRGERLRPHTDDRPKPMVEVNGVPLIAYQLGWLKKNGISQVVISCGYRCQVLQTYLGTGAQWGLDLRYAVEPRPLGRGGGIRLAMRHLQQMPSPSPQQHRNGSSSLDGSGTASDGRTPIVISNGDNLVDIDLLPPIEQHVRTQALATVVLVPLVSARGIVQVDDRGRIIRFQEKPELPYWINAGIYVFSPEMAQLLPVQGDHEDELFPRLAAEGRLYAYKTRELWRTVDTAKDLTQITRELQSGLELALLEPGGKAGAR